MNHTKRLLNGFSGAGHLNWLSHEILQKVFVESRLLLIAISSAISKLIHTLC